MQFSARIGDREVLAAGVLALGREDREVSFDLDGMVFEVRLVPQSAPLDVRFIRHDEKRLVIEISGEFPELSAAWKLTGVARAGDRQIDLDLVVYSLNPGVDAVRQLTFCFTAHPGAGTGMPPTASFGYDFTR